VARDWVKRYIHRALNIVQGESARAPDWILRRMVKRIITGVVLAEDRQVGSRPLRAVHDIDRINDIYCRIVIWVYNDGLSIDQWRN